MDVVGQNIRGQMQAQMLHRTEATHIHTDTLDTGNLGVMLVAAVNRGGNARERDIGIQAFCPQPQRHPLHRLIDPETDRAAFEHQNPNPHHRLHDLGQFLKREL